MGRPRQPIKLIEAKGKSHKTKAEIKEREETEVRGECDMIMPPDFLRTDEEREKFGFIASELLRIGIMSNLDCDVLGRYIRAEGDWVRYSSLVCKARESLEGVIGEDEDKTVLYTDLLVKYEGMKAKAFSQCQTCASALGLTITSRCRLVVPKAGDKPKENKFRRAFGGA